MDFLKTAIPHPIVPFLVDLIATSPQHMRKELIKIARYGDIAHGRGSFYHQTKHGYHELRQLLVFAYDQGKLSSYSYGTRTRDEYVEIELQKFLSNPLCRGFMISLCTHLPIHPDEVKEEKIASAAKEINVMDRQGFNPELDFDCFFSDNQMKPLHPLMKPNFSHAGVVRRAIHQWCIDLESKTLNVTMSRKLLPTYDRRQMALVTEELMTDPELATQGDVERLSLSGMYGFEGPCEVSQRWYTNQLTPRTYFVAGSTAYNQTKYTKEMWNDLVDSLECTHRRGRVNPTRIRIRGVKKALFYDLTSFTSNMRCQREFLRHLAVFADSFNVQIRDTVEGLKIVCLGDIIRRYNMMNTFPEYVVNSGDYAGLESTHGPAGFLGVFGNIATCNFLHGAVLLQFAEEEDECGCAGDDAVIVFDPDTDEEYFYGCISLIGILATEKVFSTSDIDVVYLKRRTWIDDYRGCLRSSAYIQCPSLLFFIPWAHDTRFRERSMNKQEVRFLSAQSLNSTFRSASFMKDEDVQDYTREFLRRYYSALGFSHDGYLPQLDPTSVGKKALSYPAIETIFSADYLEDTGDILYNDYVRLSIRDEPVMDRLRPRKGMRFRNTRGSRHLTLLERMKVVKRIGKGKRVYRGDHGYLKMKEELRRRKGSDRLPQAECIYEVIRDVELWANEAWDVNGAIGLCALALTLLSAKLTSTVDWDETLVLDDDYDHSDSDSEN